MSGLSNTYFNTAINEGTDAISLQGHYDDAFAIADSIDVTSDFVLDGIDFNADGIVDNTDQQIADWLSSIQDTIFSDDITQLLTLEGADLDAFLSGHDANQMLTDYYAGVSILLDGADRIDMNAVAEAGSAQFMGTLMALQDAASIIGEKLATVVDSSDQIAETIQTALNNITASDKWEENDDLVAIYNRLLDIQNKIQNGENISNSVESWFQLCTNGDNKLNELGAIVFDGATGDDISAEVIEIQELAENSDLLIGSNNILQDITSNYGSFEGMIQRISQARSNMLSFFSLGRLAIIGEERTEKENAMIKENEELTARYNAKKLSEPQQKNKEE